MIHIAMMCTCMMHEGNIFMKSMMAFHFIGWVWLIIFTILVTIKLLQIKKILEKKKK